ncbi:unnamed protein product [Moneuplotes crassus]|uniref:Uncharacterized protein n=1 Tax=Euplotes crassus TaxID=5936 RepID=A0AAD1U2Y0_EUPCR|nr:unnamed protein product [Moneuplotes crassus]
METHTGLEADQQKEVEENKGLRRDFSVKDLVENGTEEEVMEEGVDEGERGEEKQSLDCMQMSMMSISDASYLGHNLDNKIYSKMNEMRNRNIFAEKKSFLDFNESHIDGKNSFLDFTIDQEFLLSRKDGEEGGEKEDSSQKEKPKRNIFKKKEKDSPHPDKTKVGRRRTGGFGEDEKKKERKNLGKNEDQSPHCAIPYNQLIMNDGDDYNIDYGNQDLLLEQKEDDPSNQDDLLDYSNLQETNKSFQDPKIMKERMSLKMVDDENQERRKEGTLKKKFKNIFKKNSKGYKSSESSLTFNKKSEESKSYVHSSPNFAKDKKQQDSTDVEEQKSGEESRNVQPDSFTKTPSEKYDISVFAANRVSNEKSLTDIIEEPPSKSKPGHRRQSSNAPNFGSIASKEEIISKPVLPIKNINKAIIHSSKPSKYEPKSARDYPRPVHFHKEYSQISKGDVTIGDEIDNEWYKILGEANDRNEMRPTDNRSVISNFRNLAKPQHMKHSNDPRSSAIVEYYNLSHGIGMHANERDGGENVEDHQICNSANDIILQLLLLGVEKKYNMHITCDYELKECEYLFEDMADRYSYCPEAYFGLGKIYFSKNLIDKALGMFELSLQGPKRDPVYCLWAAMALLYMLQTTKSSQKKLKILHNIEIYCTECLESQSQDTNALFILLFATLSGMSQFSEKKYAPKYSPEDIAVFIKEINNYKGYLAWTEIYLYKDKKKFAIEVLEELVEFHPQIPEAYFKLCQLYNPDSDEAFETAEAMFLHCTNFHMLETKILISLVYSKILYFSCEYIQCFELLQMEYKRYPVYPVFLYYYAKYVIMSEQSSYYGSGIGCLQECKRVCVKERSPYINFYLGKFYYACGRPGKCYPFFVKANKEFKKTKKERVKILEIDSFFDEYQDFTMIVESCKKILKEYKTKSYGQFTEDDEIIMELNNIQELDPITVRILKSDYYKKILLDKRKSIQEIKTIIKEFPENEEGLFQFWEIIKEKGDMNELEFVSETLQKVCNGNSVSINSWVNALFKHSEMLIMKGNKYSSPEDRADPNGLFSHYIEESIKVLKKIGEALPPLPLPSLLTIEDPIRIKKEMLNDLNSDERKVKKPSHDCPDMDSSFLGFNFRKFHSKNNDTTSMISKSDMRSRLSEYSENEIHPFLARNRSENPNNQNLSNRDSSGGNMQGQYNRFSKNMLFSSMSQKDSFIGRNNDNTHLDESQIYIKRASEGFAVNSDVKFLYQIGKICAESGKYLEEGIKCLDDYINLLTFFDPSVSNDIQNVPVVENPTFSKAIFFVGIIFDQIGDFEEAQKFLNQASKGLRVKGEEEKYIKCQNILKRISENLY